MEFKENQICPKCGWDYDRLICGDKDCDYEVEFETSTLVE